MYAMDQQHRSSTPKEKSSTNLTGIPTQMKQNLESRSGLSFDDVRVHYHSAEPAKIGALAYTRGTQVHIGPGQERHLLHELGHVIQQKRGLVRPTTWINGLPVNDSPELERSAIHCVNEPIVQNGKDGIAPETHLAPNTDQHVLQMMTNDELNILLGWFIWKYYKGATPPLTAENMVTTLNEFAAEDKKGTLKRKFRQILLEFYQNTSKDKDEKYNDSFDQFLEHVRYHSALRIIRAHMNKEQGKPPTVAIVFGDKAFTTAKALQKRGFAVYATALETVTNKQDREEKFTERVKKMSRRNRDGLLHLYKGVALTENGEFIRTENPTTTANQNTNRDAPIYDFEIDRDPFFSIMEESYSPLLLNDEWEGAGPEDVFLFFDDFGGDNPNLLLPLFDAQGSTDPETFSFYYNEWKKNVPNDVSPFYNVNNETILWSDLSVENPEENEQTDTSLNYIRPNTINDVDQFITDISLLSDSDRQNGLCVFDHPYTKGTYIQARRSVQKLCRDFFAFAKNQGFGRAQMTVRAINAGIDSGKRIRSTLGVYELVHPGFLIYRIQRSSAKMHLKTSDRSKIIEIVPVAQSLVLKYVNLEVMFPEVCQYARLAHDGELPKYGWTPICEAISALLQSRYCPIDLLRYKRSSISRASIRAFLERFWYALYYGLPCSKLKGRGATIMEAHPLLIIDDEHSDVEE